METERNGPRGPHLSPWGHGGFGVRAAALTILIVLAFPACGLVGGGDEAAEPGEAERLTNDLNASHAQVSALRAELDQLNAQKAARAAAAAEAEAAGRISLEKARLEAIQHAQENLDVYSPEYRGEHLVWEVERSEEQQEFYYIYLLYRPFGAFDGTPGREEFIMDKRGNIEFRQVLGDPDPDTPPAP